MLGPLCTLHRKILCGGRRYVTQYFDTKQAGRRIFEICVYRLGNFDEHTMTPRQDGGFFAGLKMSQLGTSQDFRHRIFLERREACRRTPTSARRTKSFEECACDYLKNQDFRPSRHPRSSQLQHLGVRATQDFQRTRRQGVEQPNPTPRQDRGFFPSRICH